MSISTSLLAAAAAARLRCRNRDARLPRYAEGAARAKSDAYFEGGYWLPLWGALISVAAYWAMLHFGWSAAWSGWASRVTKRKWLQPALYSLPFALVGTLLTLPWLIYTGFFREHQYGLANQDFPAWATEQGIMFAVGLVMGAIFFTVIYAVISE